MSEEYLNSQLLRLFPTFNFRSTAFEFFLPTRALKNTVESAFFLKKLVTVAVCNLLKLRGVFPDQCFVTYHNVDFDVHVLDANRVIGNGNKRQAKYVVRRLNGLFDAIDRKYAKELRLRLMSRGIGESEDRIETFTFHFEYGTRPLIKMTING
ncbi:hypothetical protein B4U80_14334, partial [Leptotrombidium deliense]